ncbi:PASTA domain-containing protein [Streptomyces anthocyanicus]|uniref:PASTA domain-containing protein n=1 Tax=Streptomyces anthocyanicus TaxID=68174 RepID=UPI00365F4214
MRRTPGTPEVRVPRLVGLMAVDARETAEERVLLISDPARHDLQSTVVDYVVRQFPQPGAEVPRGAVVTVWFDLGDAEGGAGVREPRPPRPPSGGMRRELDRPGEPFEVLG